MSCAIATGPAAALDAVTGTPILTVTGDVQNTNADGVAEFDFDMLGTLDAVTFETSTIWTDGLQTFTGIELDDLLTLVGAEGETLKAFAVNDYAIEIPVSDAVDGGPIVAFLHNGEPMSLRNKGPLWIVYPYDSKSDYQSELIYSRSIWQLNRIEVQR
ncbi:molybdopterin-dependent oxidoreductase [Tropicibacter sp. Alg240-R139]|uniref:molybdopterin-dependent oxidoreductase n=1 Tax=Tropicibacter sp. Alg240-R139 TaxID=2305991 RepID=UPI001F079659|nr:molybdopterin-dependent oxidoreductase [Tropicibacter sp. Alg240-R139]